MNRLELADDLCRKDYEVRGLFKSVEHHDHKLHFLLVNVALLEINMIPFF